MEKRIIRNNVNKLISIGKIEDALDYLYSEINNERLKDEIVFLKSNFISNREQFEIKMTIDKKEYDIARSKNILGIQELLKKIDLKQIDNEKVKYNFLIKIRPYFGLFIMLSVGVAIGLFFILKSDNIENTFSTSEQINFLGNWEAEVEHKGYLIDKGNKRFYLNSEANWIIEINPNHTALMKATIDTTGKSSLDWFYNKEENKIRFIQKDETSFEVTIEESSSEYQKWSAKKVIGNKTEEWIWILKRGD